MSCRALLYRAALALLTGTVLAGAVPGTAQAADLVSNDRFRSAGVRIFDENAVGYGCTLFGYCDSATFAELSHNAVTRKRSDRKGEPVVVDCTLNDLAKVRTFSAEPGAGADKVLTGWASVTALMLVDPPQPC